MDLYFVRNDYKEQFDGYDRKNPDPLSPQTPNFKSLLRPFVDVSKIMNILE